MKEKAWTEFIFPSSMHQKKEGWSWTKYFLLDQNNFSFSSFQLPFFSAPGVLSRAAPNQCLLYIQHYLSVPLPGCFPVFFVSLSGWTGGSGPREPTLLFQDSCRVPFGPDTVWWRGTGREGEGTGLIFFPNKIGVGLLIAACLSLHLSAHVMPQILREQRWTFCLLLARVLHQTCPLQGHREWGEIVWGDTSTPMAEPSG